MNEELKAEISRDVDYALGTFRGYLATFPQEKIPGANLCELGPGKNLGIALLFKGLGANTVHVVDKYLKPWSDQYHPYFYKMLKEEAVRNFPGFDPEPLLITSEKGYEKAPIIIWENDAETMAGIDDESLDFLCSNAVLEHLYLPAQAFASFARVSCKGAYGHHQIDFRDHYNFDRPLEFLMTYYRWNEPLTKEAFEWLAKRLDVSQKLLESRQIDDKVLIRRMCGYFGNSFRHTDYDVLWKENNFHINSFEVNGQAEETYLNEFCQRLQKNPHRANLPDKEKLRVTSALYRLIKQ